jgi:hypothetical protein
MSVFRVAIERWANSADERSLPVIMKDAMAELRAVTAGSAGSPEPDTPEWGPACALSG